MKIRWIKIFLFGWVFLSGFLLWMMVDRAINVSGSSVWLMPILSVSFFAIAIYAATIVIRSALYLNILLAATYGASFFFVRSHWHGIGFILACVFSCWAIKKIKEDMGMNIRFSASKSIRAGSGLFIFALAFIITSQYYGEIRNLDSEKIIPKFYVSATMGNLTARVLAMTNPEIRDVKQEDLTVDQFILQTQKSDIQSKEISLETELQVEKMIELSHPSATAAQKKIIKEDALQKVRSTSVEMGKEQEKFILVEGRKKFAEMLGAPVSGEEKMADILTGIVNKKLDQYFGTGLKESGKESPLPYVMALGLLLTIIPMGTILNNFWIWLVQLFFWVLLKTETVKLKSITVEAEVLE